MFHFVANFCIYENKVLKLKLHLLAFVYLEI